jgi:hypothetical protein
MEDKLRLELEITDEILEVANLYDEVSTSDLQGIAQAKAQDIIRRLSRKKEEDLTQLFSSILFRVNEARKEEGVRRVGVFEEEVKRAVKDYLAYGEGVGVVVNPFDLITHINGKPIKGGN